MATDNGVLKTHYTIRKDGEFLRIRTNAIQYMLREIRDGNNNR